MTRGGGIDGLTRGGGSDVLTRETMDRLEASESTEFDAMPEKGGRKTGAAIPVLVPKVTTSGTVFI